MICLTVGLTAFSGQDAAPSIVVDDPVKDFGKVMKGETLKHVFQFSNKGSGTLEISDVSATCGCQTTALPSKQINAGGSGQIEMSVDTSLLIGAVTESVTLTTNDPFRPSVLFSIKADVQSEISLSSPSVFFENVPEGVEAKKEVLISVAAKKSIKILSAESTDESVSVKLESVAGSADSQVRLIATHKSDGRIGYRMESIIVKTTSDLTPELIIHLIIRNFSR